MNFTWWTQALILELSSEVYGLTFFERCEPMYSLLTPQVPNIFYFTVNQSLFHYHWEESPFGITPTWRVPSQWSPFWKAQPGVWIELFSPSALPAAWQGSQELQLLCSVIHNACPFSRSARWSSRRNYAGTLQNSLEFTGSLAWLIDQTCFVSALAAFFTSQALEVRSGSLIILWQGNARRRQEVLCILFSFFFVFMESEPCFHIPGTGFRRVRTSVWVGFCN